METKGTFIKQQSDTDVGKSIARNGANSRIIKYYSHLIGHLRESSRRKIFPITRKSRQVNNQSIDSKYKLIAIDNGKLINKKISNCLDANYYKGLDCHQQRTGVMIKEATKQGYTEANIGNSINYSQPNSKTRRGRVSNIANTLDTGCQQGVVTEDIRIRKLTPKECERLQGFPDEYSRYGIKDGEIVNISDSQRYKCLGNAVSVPVIEAIITELFKK